MILEPTRLAGVHLLLPEPARDHRGFFARVYDRDQLAAQGLCTEYPQWSVSFSTRCGTLRGLHWQDPPYLETKLLQCIRGAVFDVAVDLRAGSPQFGQCVHFELSAENRGIAYIPAGFAHGFQTLTDDAEVLYHISAPYNAAAARGLRWNDPALAIPWPACDERILSERDAALPGLADIAPIDVASS